MRRILMMGVFVFGVVFGAKAQQVNSRQWKSIADNLPTEWYSTDEARRIADQVLVYQRESGGWPKNIQMHRPMSDEVRRALDANDKAYEATMDNSATTTEMKFMAKMYEATREPRYRESFERGLGYLLEAQYDNGGWPQFYPLKRGYYTHITYNDNAMNNIMRLLKEIFDENPQYGFVATPETIAQARAAFDKGIECILATQIVVDGEPTVWCAQHDEVTLEPAKARAYELPSFSGSESVGLVQLLMEVDPTPEVIRAVDGAVKWFEEHKIEGIRVEEGRTAEGRDRWVVADPEAPAIWARFYDLETGRPFFVGRDGVKKETLAEIEQERRGGYGYYTNSPQKVLDKYPRWQTRVARYLERNAE